MATDSARIGKIVSSLCADLEMFRVALEKIAKRGARGMTGDELSACGQIAQSALDSLEIHGGDA